jgi:hypothetical protein
VSFKLPLALAWLVLVSGCASFTDTATPPSDWVAAWRVADVRLLPTGDRGIQDGVEPSVVADRKGNVFVTAARKVIASAPHPDESVSASWLWTSNDGGKSFRLVPPLGSSLQYPPFGTEGHLSIAPSGDVYFVDLTLASFSLAASTDHGATWELRNVAASNIPGGDRPWVAAGPGMRVHAVWNQIPSGFYVLTSDDGGRTFPHMVNVPGTMAGLETLGVAGAPDGYEVPGVPVVGPDGTLFIARGEAGSVAVYASTDGGRSLTRTVAWRSDERVGWIFSTPAVDAAGVLYVSTVEVLDGTTRVRYAVSTDRGVSFSAPREVGSLPGTHVLQWGAAGEAGEFAVAYYAADETGRPSDVGGPWRVRVAVSSNAHEEAALFEELTLTESAVHDGPICTGGTVGCGNDQTRELADYLGLAWGEAGTLHVGWTDAAGGRPLATYGRLEHRWS